MKTGILGLGIIGSAWAHNLDQDGLLAACWNRSDKRGFPRLLKTPAEVAQAAELLIVCVADPPAVESVLDAMNIDSRHLVVQTSTIDPASSRRFCAKVRATGARYLESPFTGSKPAAESRTTVFYLGGDPADVAAAEPVLSRISQARRVIGTPEQAAAFKLSQNLLIASYAEALCESLRFARAAGISDDTYFATLRLTVAWNGFTALKEPKLRTGDYSTQFSVKHMLKDMRLALLAGDRSLPITKAVTDCLQRAADAGLGNEDFIALYKTLGA